MVEERKWGNGLSKKKKKQTKIFILKITIKTSFKYDITRTTMVELQNSYLYGVLNLQVLQRSIL